MGRKMICDLATVGNTKDILKMSQHTFTPKGGQRYCTSQPGNIDSEEFYTGLIRIVMNDVHTWLRWIANDIRIISDMHELVSTGACVAHSDVQLSYRGQGDSPILAAVDC